MKDRPLEDRIHARLRELTSEVKALREELQGSLRKPTRRTTIRAWNVRGEAYDRREDSKKG